MAPPNTSPFHRVFAKYVAPSPTNWPQAPRDGWHKTVDFCAENCVLCSTKYGQKVPQPDGKGYKYWGYPETRVMIPCGHIFGNRCLLVHQRTKKNPVCPVCSAKSMNYKDPSCNEFHLIAGREIDNVGDYDPKKPRPFHAAPAPVTYDNLPEKCYKCIAARIPERIELAKLNADLKYFKSLEAKFLRAGRPTGYIVKQYMSSEKKAQHMVANWKQALEDAFEAAQNTSDWAFEPVYNQKVAGEEFCTHESYVWSKDEEPKALILPLSSEPAEGSTINPNVSPLLFSTGQIFQARAGPTRFPVSQYKAFPGKPVDKAHIEFTPEVMAAHTAELKAAYAAKQQAEQMALDTAMGGVDENGHPAYGSYYGYVDPNTGYVQQGFGFYMGGDDTIAGYGQQGSSSRWEDIAGPSNAPDATTNPYYQPVIRGSNADPRPLRALAPAFVPQALNPIAQPFAPQHIAGQALNRFPVERKPRHYQRGRLAYSPPRPELGPRGPVVNAPSNAPVGSRFGAPPNVSRGPRGLIGREGLLGWGAFTGRGGFGGVQTPKVEPPVVIEFGEHEGTPAETAALLKGKGKGKQ